MKIRKFALAALIASLSLSVHADHSANADKTVRADSHAPIGVMADHVHAKSEWMFSYRFMRMEMEGNLKGTSSIDPDTIVTTEPNRFAGMPGMPPTLRIVPLDMTMDMHMLGAMYAPSDRFTLMLMANYWQKSMDHVTYVGGMGTDVLGEFSTETSGWGDTSFSSLISFLNTPEHKVHAIVGLTLPTGDVKQTDDILTPMNMRPTVRVPYPMQLGSGTIDPIVGLSYSGFGERLAWGAQWRSVFRIDDNDEGYRLGDEHRVTGWLSLLLTEPVSISARLEYFDRGNIEGIDPSIMGPVQTADPDRQAAERVDLGIGVNFAGQGALAGWRIGIEYLTAIEQDLAGPQLETDQQLIVGVQKSF